MRKPLFYAMQPLYGAERRERSARRRVWLKRLLAVCAVAFLLLYGVPLIASWVTRAWLIGYLGGLFDRETAIGHVWLNPWQGRLEIHDIQVPEAPGLGSGNLLAIQKARVRLNVWELLDRRLHLRLAELEGISINLHCLEHHGVQAGRFSFFRRRSSAPQKASSIADQGARLQGRSLPQWSMQLDVLSLSNSAVAWRDSRSGTRLREAELKGLSGVITNLAYMASNSCAATFAGVWLEGEWVQGKTNQPAIFTLLGNCEPLAGRVPDISLSVQLAGCEPSWTLCQFWPSAAQAFENRRYDIALAGGISGRNVDFSFEMTNLEGEPVAQLEQAFYDWKDGCGWFDGLSVLYPDGSLPRPVFAAASGGFHHFKQGSTTSLKVNLEEPLVTWPGRRQERRPLACTASEQQSEKRVASRIGGGFVLEDVSMSGGDVAYAERDASGCWRIVASGHALNLLGTNIWFHGGVTPENEQGFVLLSGFCGFSNGAPAEVHAALMTKPGLSAWLPELSVTGSVTGFVLPDSLSASQRKLIHAFVTEPLSMNFNAALSTHRSACSLSVLDAVSNESLRLDDLRYDWDTGEMRLKMLGVCQPLGFGSGFMLALRNARVKANPDFLATRRFAISNGVLSGLEIVLARNEKGVLNLDDLSEAATHASTAHSDTAMCDPSVSESQHLEFSAKRLFLTNAFLLYKGYAASDVGVKKLAACWGEANNFEYSAQGSDVSMLSGSLALGGVWRQGGEGQDALFNGSLNLLWARPALPEIGLTCGFTNLMVASFGQAPPAWCRAFLGNAVLSGKLDIVADANSLTASGKVANAVSYMEAGFESLTWEHDSNEWLLRNVVVSQPELFGAEKLFAAGFARLRTAARWRPGYPLVIRDFYASDVLANVACDPSGRWLWSFFKKSAPSSPRFSFTPAESTAKGGATGLAIERASLERLRIGYLEQCRNKPHIASSIEVDSCELDNLIFGKAPDEHAEQGSFAVSARLQQAERTPALLIVDGRQELAHGGSPEWYITLGITDWAPLDFFAPEDRAIWERDVGPLDVAAAIGLSEELVDASFEVCLADGSVLAKCDAADWQPGMGELSLRGLRIESPKTFRLSPLLDAPEVRLRLGHATPSDPCIRVQKALVSSSSLRFERNLSGACNTDYLKALFHGLPSSSKAETPETPLERSALPVFLEQARIEGMSVCYMDPLAGRHGLDLRLVNVRAEARQLPLGPIMGLQEDHDGTAFVSACLEQDDLPDGFFSMTLKSESFENGEQETRIEAAIDGLSPAVLQGLAPGGLNGAPLSVLANAAIDRRGIKAEGILQTFDGEVLFSAGGIDYCRESGNLLFTDIFMAQLPGFGEGPLLLLPNACVHFAQPRSADASLRLEQINMDGLGLFPARNRSGHLNILTLTEAFRQMPAAAEKIPKSREKSPGLRINHFSVKNAFGIYTDFSALEPTPVALKMDNVRILGTGIRWGGEEEEDALPGELGFAARLLQAPLPNGYVGGVARFDALGPGIPNIKASLRAVGLEFATLAGWLPPNTPELLGADAADVAADLEMTPQNLHCDLQILTSADTRFSLSLRGAPSKPQVTTGSVLYGILTRAGGGLGIFARHTLGAGAEVVQSVAQTTYSIAQSVWSMVESVSSGFFTTLRGVVTADVADMTDGLSKTTIGAFDATTEPLRQAGMDVMEAADRATSQGSRAANKWRSRNFERWLEAWDNVHSSIPATDEQHAPEAGEPEPEER